MILGRLPSKHSEVICHCAGLGRPEESAERRGWERGVDGLRGRSEEHALRP